jgi:gamma-glutamylcyclotransferase (GGCT)/AIG2-like uncharacterized protein YtfP
LENNGGVKMNEKNRYIEKLFSYGTLRYEAVQLATFGRKLDGVTDAVLGYKLSSIEITDAEVIALSGESTHHMLIYTGNKTDTVEGMVFDVSAEELQAADQYEVADYKRISAPLRSGAQAWVYASAEQKND